jgi:general secretion pathway protein L
MSATTTLRVLIDAPPDANRLAEWALFDRADRLVRSARDRPSAWPPAERREAVIGAAHGRLATATVPPLPPARAAAAARFALEDQLAGAPEESHIALGPQAADGSIRTAILAEDWMRAFAAASARCGIDWDAALLESDLAPAAAGTWRWCARAVDAPGFVRTDRGATIAVGPAAADAPPAELAAALAAASQYAPRSVRVDAAGASASFLAQARARTRVEFVAGTPWRWADAPAAAFAGAIDLLTGRYGAAPPTAALDPARLLRPALWVAGLAIVIQACAGSGEWVWLRWQNARIDSEIRALAQGAVPELAAQVAAGVTPSVALARRERDLKHRAGLVASDDLLPLLSRAAPALATLPAGAVRGFSYADGHLVLELQKLAPGEPARVQRELQRGGLVAIAAPSASGARLRIGLD